MSGPELCPKCKGLHFKTAPCVQRKVKPMPSASTEMASQGFESPAGQFKRGRGRPKTITDMKAYKAKWARDYRARKASKSNPNTPERNDE